MNRRGAIARSVSLAFAVCACVGYIVHQQRRAGAGADPSKLASEAPATRTPPAALLPSTKNPNVRFGEPPPLLRPRAPE